MKKNVKRLTVIGIAALIFLASLNVQGSEAKNLKQVASAEIAKTAVKWWIISTTWELYNFLMDIFDSGRLFTLIAMNPSTDVLKNPQGFFIKLIQPFFVLAIVLTAAYILLYSHSVKGRFKAKAVLIRLIFTMILVSVAPVLSGVLLNASGAVTNAIMSQANKELVVDSIHEGTESMFSTFKWLTAIHRTGGVELLLLWETFLLILNLALATRYVMVIFWNTLLPISLLMLSFTPTKTIGKKFLHQTFLWTFVQIGWAIALVIIGAAVMNLQSVAPDYPMAKIGIACLLVLITTPMMVLGVMDWLSMGVEVVEIVNAAPLSIAALTVDEMKVEREVVLEEEALDGV